MLVNEIMTRDPVTILPSATVADAMEVLESMSIRHLPVVNEGGELVGVVSDRDLRNASVPMYRASDRVRGVALRQVTDVMSGDVAAVREQDDVAEAVDLMLTQQVGAIPVVNADGELAGIVSYVDVLRVVRELI